MKIIDDRKPVYTHFVELNYGDTFLDSQGRLSMKMATFYDEANNTFNTMILGEGAVKYTDLLRNVEVVKSTIHFE